MITLEQAKNLYCGQILYHVKDRDSRGNPTKWRTSGMPKTWKRSPEKVRVPIMHGLYDHDYLTEHELGLLCLTEEEALAEGGKK